MNRREVLKSGLAAGIAGKIKADAAADDGPHYYELRTYELRNDLQPARIQDFFKNHFMPMAKRQGLGPVGCFNVVSGLSTPSLIVLIDYKSLADFQSAGELVSADKDFMKAWQDFEAAGELPYSRYQSVLLKAFASHPRIEVPSADEKRPPRIFELRTYESKNVFSLRTKIDMFNQEEIKIFRACGFSTIFFGEAIFGTGLPHLTYMVGFDNMAARDKAWETFGGNPDWARIRVKSGWTDPEIVTNIHAAFLRPTNYSQIR
ncbi:MAG: NIPSNAP family protein [Blastocatellia bacterium]|nr:NIPSNAP family protein [Blastocatellia bacterium]